MDSFELESLLLRLDLDSMNAKQVAGMEAFPILSVDGSTVYARPKTVMTKNSWGRYVPMPGIAYIVVDENLSPVAQLGGDRLYVGRTETSIDLFVSRFGRLFSRNEIEVEKADDPFARLLVSM